jgi:hypothetical protein
LFHKLYFLYCADISVCTAFLIPIYIFKMLNFSQVYWHMPVILVLCKLKQEDLVFEANPGHMARPCVKKQGMMVHVSNPRTWETEAGRSNSRPSWTT